GIFYGFLTTGPVKGFIPLPILMKFVFKPVPVGERGEAILAPHGLRRIESALIEKNVVSEDEIIVAPPESLKKVVGKNTKIIGIHSHDFLGRGPASTTFSGPTGIIHEEPISAWSFKQLVTSPVIQNARKNGCIVVAGGPGAWQFTYKDMEILGVDLVIYGEGEKIVPKIFSRILNGVEKDFPKIIYTDPRDIPSVNEIPLLRGATIGGIVEVSRGCGRGCAFCRPNLVPLRHRPIEHILEDVKTNLKYGQRNICLHAEDIFRYGSNPFNVNHRKVVELFEKVSKIPGVNISSFSHANLSSIAGYPETVEAVSNILGTDYHNWIGYQTGIETGSPYLIERLMKYKPYPFKPKDWREVVEMGFAISNDNGFVPAATLIINLPGEKEKDILYTIELIEDLKEYKSLIVPLLYVPMNPREKMMRFIEDAEWYHWELYRVIWDHDVKWLPIMVEEYSRKNNPATRIFMKSFIKMVKYVGNRYVLSFIQDNLEKKMREKHILLSYSKLY
ncbi:MAG TPA: B12-binding domain-containing radical SAM protein, partial [Thermoprotei archaeon]|nr:B12-binding domain-containing radical SAM protein [Thermoprotei archaeon]